jgi:hypothetical protein
MAIFILMGKGNKKGSTAQRQIKAQRHNGSMAQQQIKAQRHNVSMATAKPTIMWDSSFAPLCRYAFVPLLLCAFAPFY